MKNKPLVYLAVPYTHPRKSVIEDRFIKVCKMAGKLMNDGYIVYSPITHCHPIAMVCKLPTDWKFWKNIDETFLKLSHKMYILMLDGWQDSTGIKNEVEIANDLGIEIEYIEYTE